jgi:hypothetical protein
MSQVERANTVVDGNGGHCLIGALLHMSRKRGLPTAPAIALLSSNLGLVQRDDMAGNAGGSAIYAAVARPQYR